jgi:CHAT domain-containing protein
LLQPTYERLLDYLETNIVHIVHFDGHGVFARQCPQCGAMNYPHQTTCATCNQAISYIAPQGYLAFENTNRQVHWVSSESFSTLLYNRQLRLIVLSACWSGSVGGETVFGGLAPSLIQAGVPAVVATQLPISVDAARKFMQGFYRALVRFETIPAAMNAGRIRIFERTQEWFIPTLYLRSRDEQGNLFSLK